MTPKTIGFVVFNELAYVEFSGAAETFAQAHLPTNYGCECHCYTIVTIGLSAEPCYGRAGVVVKPDFDFQSAPELDTLIVCGADAIRALPYAKKWPNG